MAARRENEAPAQAAVDRSLSRMDEAAMLALLDNPIARKLAVAWPHLEAAERETQADWAKVAGVPSHEMGNIPVSLRRCGVCRDDGTTHEIALQFIATQMLGPSRPKRGTS